MTDTAPTTHPASPSPAQDHPQPAGKPTEAQANALRILAEPGAELGDVWDDYDGSERHLSYYRHERTIDSLRRRGWIDEHGAITDAGRKAVSQAADPAPPDPMCKCGHPRSDHGTGRMGKPGRCDHGGYNLRLARLGRCQCLRYGRAS